MINPAFSSYQRGEKEKALINAALERNAHDPYNGEKLTRPTIDHVKPRNKFKNKKGKKNKDTVNTISNYVVSNSDENTARASRSLKSWIRNPEYMQNYLDKMRGVVINGTDYVSAVLPTINKEVNDKFTFKGRNLNYAA